MEDGMHLPGGRKLEFVRGKTCSISKGPSCLGASFLEG